MFQHLIAAFPYSQIGLPVNYIEIGDYYEKIQAQMREME